MTPKIVYVAGWSRSGSTILDRVLGAAEGWFSCGELRLVWGGTHCTCGEQAFDCPVWRPALTSALAEHRLDREGVLALRRRWQGSDLRSLLEIARASRRRAGTPLLRYAALIRELYVEIAASAGARVIVDSSKAPQDGFVAASLTGLETHVVHLVRDPRGVAFSLSRRRAVLPWTNLELERMSPARSSSYWLRRNAAIEAILGPQRSDMHTRVKYEDFAREPDRVVGTIRALVGEPAAHPALTGERLELPASHMVGGNPVRFADQVAIRPDLEWTARMGARARLAATLPALPLMPRYGYRMIRPARAAPTGGATPST